MRSQSPGGALVSPRENPFIRTRKSNPDLELFLWSCGEEDLNKAAHRFRKKSDIFPQNRLTISIAYAIITNVVRASPLRQANMRMWRNWQTR